MAERVVSTTFDRDAESPWEPMPGGIQAVDDGCSLHDHCLTCPFPKCFLDAPNPRAAIARYRAWRVLVDFENGYSVPDLGYIYKKTGRSIYRLLRQARSDPECSEYLKRLDETEETNVA